MPVQVQSEHLDHCRVELTIEVPPEDIQKAVDSVFNQFARRANVPGFRPGKAPRHLVKRFIDEGRVKDLAFEQALTSAYREALRQSGVDPYPDAEPKVDMPEEELDAEKGFSFKATVPLQPHVHLGDLEGLSGRRVVTRISDADVNREIYRFREQAITFEAGDAPAELGDRIRATVRTTIGGEDVEEATFLEPRLVQLGTNLEALDQGMIGMRAGEERTFEFTYPEDFDDDDKRGKTAVARVVTSEVLRRVIPEADDAFAVTAGFASIAELRDRVQTNLQSQADGVADQELTDGLVREVVRRSVVHFPEEMLDREASGRLRTLITALERRSLTLEMYLRSERKDLATLEAELRDQALESIRNSLTLIELSRQNGLILSEKEVETELRRRAEAEGVKLSQLRRLLGETGEIDTVRDELWFRKIADFLQERAEIREIKS